MDTSGRVTYRSNVVSELSSSTKLRWGHTFGAYRLADGELASGSLLGSPTVQMKLKATGAIEKMYCSGAGKVLLKNFVLKHWDERSGMKLDPVSGHFFFFPEHQERRFMLSNGIYAEERLFVSVPPPSAVHYVLDLTNDAEEPQRISTYAFCELATSADDDVMCEYDEEARALIARGKDDHDLARMVGAARKPRSYEITIDHAKAVMPRYPGKLSGETTAPRGLATAVLHYSTALDPGESATIPFRLCVSANGRADVKKIYAVVPAPKEALTQTREQYRDVLARTIAITPNAQINRGILWSKTNMQRVILDTPQGWAFTNDPLQSTKCVGRDTAWFCAGTDYFRSDFSARCIKQFFDRQEPSGLIVEDFDFIDGKTQDNELNINDDTPLIVWSAWHHYQMSGDRTFLQKSYDAMLKACRHIAEQRNDRGLVWCTSEKTGAKGIIGWRNVIKGYRLSGATTEVNAECYAAFRCMAACARELGRDGDAREFEDLAAALKDAINTHLYNPGNGLYYLNIDVFGVPRSDITADLVFPVLFDVAEDDVAARIIRRLSDRDFWTPGGMRTIPYDAVNYTPEGSDGCLGGVWNGMTFWFAKAAAKFMPDFAVEALANGFQNYARDPQRNNTVPGEFSEWLHGETLVNSGMLLSPWFPPRYLWAVLEGILGFDISGDRPRITPRLDQSWMWAGSCNVPYREEALTWFCARTPEQRLWSSANVDADCPCDVLGEDFSDRVSCSGDDAVSVALRDGSRIVVLVGNTSDRTITTALRMREVESDLTGRSYERIGGRWSEERLSSADLHSGIPFLIDPHGFRLYELSA
jgi:hypothetical protein